MTTTPVLPVKGHLLKWTFNGEERGSRFYDDERHCIFDAESDGGVCEPLCRVSDALAAIAAAQAAQPTDAELLRNATNVERRSDQSVTVVFSSCRAASEFERAALVTTKTTI